MRSKLFFLPPTLALVCATAFPLTSQAQGKREVAVKLDEPGYLFLQGARYFLTVNVPGKEVPPDVPTQVVSFGVECEFNRRGPVEIQDLKLKCQGVTYAVAARKALVLEDQSKIPGLSIRTAPDPNGSGNVELIVCWNGDKLPEPGYIEVRDYNGRSGGIEVIRASGDSNGSDATKYYASYTNVLLRNTTAAPFTIKPDFFKNVPPVKDWPEVIIPPARAR